MYIFIDFMLGFGIQQNNTIIGEFELPSIDPSYSKYILRLRRVFNPKSWIMHKEFFSLRFWLLYHQNLYFKICFYLLDSGLPQSFLLERLLPQSNKPPIFFISDFVLLILGNIEVILIVEVFTKAHFE